MSIPQTGLHLILGTLTNTETADHLNTKSNLAMLLSLGALMGLSDHDDRGALPEGKFESPYSIST